MAKRMTLTIVFGAGFILFCRAFALCGGAVITSGVSDVVFGIF